MRPAITFLNIQLSNSRLKGLAGEEIILPEEVSKGAKRCIDRMLELN